VTKVQKLVRDTLLRGYDIYPNQLISAPDMIQTPSPRGRRKKGGRGAGRKARKRGKGRVRVSPFPSLPYPLPFSLFFYSLPLSTPATQANKHLDIHTIIFLTKTFPKHLKVLQDSSKTIIIFPNLVKAVPEKMGKKIENSRHPIHILHGKKRLQYPEFLATWRSAV